MEVLLVRAAVPFPCPRRSQKAAEVSDPPKAHGSASSSQSKFLASDRSTDAPSMAAASSSLSVDAQTSPLPSLVPHAGSGSLFPIPLRFRWFNRSGKKDVAGDVGAGRPLAAGADTASSAASSTEVSTTFALNADEKRTMHEVLSTLQSSSQLSALELGSLSSDVGISNAVLVGAREGVELSKAEAEIAKSWIHNFMNIKSLWNSRQESAKGLKTPRNRQHDKQGQSGAAPATIESEVAQELAEERHGPEVGADAGGEDERVVECVCEECSVEDMMSGPSEGGRSNEIPHVETAHNRDTFSKFLHRVSLPELKTVSHMSFLSNLAYVIPTIQPTDLLKNHHLRFITSSVHRKAAEELKEKPEKEKVARDKGTPQEKMSSKGQDVGVDPQISVAESENLSGELTAGCNCGSCSPVMTNIIIAAGLTASQVQSPTGSAENEKRATSMKYQSKIDLASAVVASTGPIQQAAGVPIEEETKQTGVKDLQSLHSCPCEWFVCDDERSHTRYFAIQGSDSLASWQANLLFQPMPFEDPKLGVMAHRGIYEAAKGLYEQILPLVLEHLQKHGDRARIRFTGHSLGGSLAILLSLMLRNREAAPLSSLLPVFTFGSPYVLCGGDHLLKQLGFPQNHVQMVIMHRDIVPRSFTCDYPDHVAEVLKRVNGSFRDHTCLNNQKLLYAPMGIMRILQPPPTQAPGHPFLPAGSGLYDLQHPSFVNSQELDTTSLPSKIQLRSAQRAFLNSPHPLEILSDRGSYGSGGSISRDHDPRSYAKAVTHLMRQELKKLRRANGGQSVRLMWPLLGTDIRLEFLKGVGLENSVNTGEFGSMGAASSGMGANSQALRRSVGFISDGQSNSYPRNTSASGSIMDRMSRYSRLIASKHVHMGMLLIVSARILLLRGLATFIG